jgi:Mg2+-importing ATPase
MPIVVPSKPSRVRSRLNTSGLLTGPEIDGLSDHALREAVEHTTVFARVNPEQKLRIIETLRHNRHVVGYLGDGINDAPALGAADIGISVNNAVDVAKQTASLILLRKSLDSLIDGVIEGRRTYANTLKYLMMSLGSNFGNIFSMDGSSASAIAAIIAITLGYLVCAEIVKRQFFKHVDL